MCSKPRLRRSRRVSSPRQGNRPSSSTLRCKRGLSAYTSYPFGLSKEKRERPMRRQAPTRAVVCVSIPGLWIFIIRTNSPILLTAEVQKISGIYPAIAFALNKAIEFCYKTGQIVLIRGKSRNSPLFSIITNVKPPLRWLNLPSKRTEAAFRKAASVSGRKARSPHPEVRLL